MEALAEYIKALETSGGLIGPDYNSPYSSIGQFASVLINFLMGGSFSLAIISLGYAGILYSNSSGDPKNVQRAQQALLWGLIALALSLAAVAAKVILFGQVFEANETVPDVPEF